MSTGPNISFVMEALNIHKSFGHVQALRGCSFRVRRGEIHALLGQNGAGKSTLVKILNGVHPGGAFSGEILVEGKPVVFRSPAHARMNGVGYVPQEIEVLENLSVTENIYAGQMGATGSAFVRWAQLSRRASELLKELGLDLEPTALAASLSTAQRHLVMIARALVTRPAVLILDEPTASLSSNEISRLFDVLRALRDRGTALIYITHRLPELFTLCDRASVLRDGIISEEFERQYFSIEQLVTAMSGRQAATHRTNRKLAREGEVLMQVRNLSVSNLGRRKVNNVSFALKRGEILGIAGLVGAGRTELLSALYGHMQYEGTILLDGRELQIRSPRDARNAGIALLTEDRKRSGLLFNLPISANITIGNLGLFATSGLLRPKAERNGVQRMLAELNVKASSGNSMVTHLSGGNQQKLLFARVLLGSPKILLLDEPSKGVDIATRQEIYRLIVTLAESGFGVIIVSSELEEVIELADRCLVITEGRIVDEFSQAEASEERVLHSIARAQSFSSALN